MSLMISINPSNKLWPIVLFQTSEMLHANKDQPSAYFAQSCAWMMVSELLLKNVYLWLDMEIWDNTQLQIIENQSTVSGINT